LEERGYQASVRTFKGEAGDGLLASSIRTSLAFSNLIFADFENIESFETKNQLLKIYTELLG
jgi:hypothetical protein